MGSELLQSPPLPPPPKNILTVSMKIENTYNYGHSNSILGSFTYRYGYMYKNAYCSSGFIYLFFWFGFCSNNLGNTMKVPADYTVTYPHYRIAIDLDQWLLCIFRGKKRKWQRNVNMNDQTFIKMNEYRPKWLIWVQRMVRMTTWAQLKFHFNYLPKYAKVYTQDLGHIWAGVCVCITSPVPQEDSAS